MSKSRTARRPDGSPSAGGAPPVAAGRTPGLRRLVFFSLLAGLSSLIPVPFLDEWTRDLWRRRLVAELADRHRLVLPGPDLRLLACGPPDATLPGCLRGCFAWTLLKPLVLVARKLFKKTFRKIVMVLMVKDCVDGFSRTFHEACLIRHAMALSIDRSPDRDRPVLGWPVPDLRWAIDVTVGEVDPRPVEQAARRALRGSRKLLRRAGRRLTRVARGWRRSGREEEELVRGDVPLGEEEELLGGLVDELTDGLERQDRYLARLERDLERRLDRAVAAPAPHLVVQ